MAEYIERESLLKEMLGLHSIPVYIGHVTDEDIMFKTMIDVVKKQPTADVVEVSKVAEILDDAFGNDYPCNFNNIDEWLPYVCEYANTCDCSSVKCWEQLIKHYGERRCE